MQFAGQVAELKARVLVDTGATGCFLANDFIDEHMLHVGVGIQM